MVISSKLAKREITIALTNFQLIGESIGATVDVIRSRQDKTRPFRQWKAHQMQENAGR